MADVGTGWRHAALGNGSSSSGEASVCVSAAVWVHRCSSVVRARAANEQRDATPRLPHRGNRPHSLSRALLDEAPLCTVGQRLLYRDHTFIRAFTHALSTAPDPLHTIHLQQQRRGDNRLYPLPASPLVSCSQPHIHQLQPSASTHHSTWAAAQHSAMSSRRHARWGAALQRE